MHRYCREKLLFNHLWELKGLFDVFCFLFLAQSKVLQRHARGESGEDQGISSLLFAEIKEYYMITKQLDSLIASLCQ